MKIIMIATAVAVGGLLLHPINANANFIHATTGLASCQNLTVISAHDYSKAGSTKHNYQFEGRCTLVAFVMNAGQPLGWFAKPVNARIFAEFDNGQAKENITVYKLDEALSGWQISDNLPSSSFAGIKKINLSYACGGDPWFDESYDWRDCNVQSWNHHEAPAPRVWPLWQLCQNATFAAVCVKFSNVDMAQPLSRHALNAVKAHVAQTRTTPHPPLIVCPKRNGIYPTNEALMFDIRYIDPQLKFGQVYKYPQDAGTVDIIWERWIPGTSGTGGEWVRDRKMLAQFPNVLHSKGPVRYGATINLGPIPCGKGELGIEPQRKDEGRWRIKAKHRTSGWPWTSWVEFQIGEKVDYSKPTVSINRPTEGEEADKKPSKIGFYDVDFVFFYQPDASGKGSGHLEFELERFEADHSTNQSGWGVTHSIRRVVEMSQLKVAAGSSPKSNASSTEQLQQGLWRIRARPKLAILGLVAASGQHPWTPWRHFYAGEKVKLDPNKLALAAGASGNIAGQGNLGIAPDPEKSKNMRSKGSPAFKLGVERAPQLGNSGVEARPQSGEGDVVRKFGGKRQSALGAKRPQNDLMQKRPSSNAVQRPQETANLAPRLRLSSPSPGQTIRGNLTVQIEPLSGANLSNLRVEFERWDGTAWRKQALRGANRLSATAGRLIVPRDRFGEGGKWRLRVGRSEGSAMTRWHEFSFVSVPKRAAPPSVKERPIDPAVIGKPAVTPDVKRVTPRVPEVEAEKTPERAAPIDQPSVERPASDIRVDPSLLEQRTVPR